MPTYNTAPKYMSLRGGKGLPDEVIQLFITLILKSIFYSDFELLNNRIATPWRARNDRIVNNVWGQRLFIPHPASLTKEWVLSNSDKSGDSSLRSEWQNEWWKYTKFVIPNLFRNLSVWLWLKLIDSKAIRYIPKILRFWNKFRMTKFLVKSSDAICSELLLAKLQKLLLWEAFTTQDWNAFYYCFLTYSIILSNLIPT